MIETYAKAYRGLPRTVWILSLVMFINRCGTMVLPFLTLYLTQEKGIDIQVAGQVLAVYGLGSILGGIWAAGSAIAWAPSISRSSAWC